MNTISETALQQTHRIIRDYGLDIPALRDLPANLNAFLTPSQQKAITHLGKMQQEVEQMLTAKRPTALQA